MISLTVEYTTVDTGASLTNLDSFVSPLRSASRGFDADQLDRSPRCR
jgi:glutaredoxin-related protein